MNIGLIRLCERLAADELELIADGIQRQMDDDFTPVWDMPVRIVTEPKGGETCRVYVVDDVADAPSGAWGWKEVDADGKPFGIVPLRYSNYVHEPVSVGISREVLGLAVDPWLNRCVTERFRTRKKTCSIAMEVTGPVQDRWYSVDTGDGLVNVANFVYPDWFRREAMGRMDRMGVVKDPQEVSERGFIMRNRSGKNWIEGTHRYQKIRPYEPHFHCREWRRRKLWCNIVNWGYVAHLAKWEAELRRTDSVDGLNEAAAWAVRNLGKIGAVEEREDQDA